MAYFTGAFFPWSSFYFLAFSFPFLLFLCCCRGALRRFVFILFLVFLCMPCCVLCCVVLCSMLYCAVALVSTGVA